MPYDALDVTDMDEARASATPSFSSGQPRRPLLIPGAISALWGLLCLRALLPHGLLVWAVGFVYVAYDALLMGFVWWNMRRHPAPTGPASPLPPVAVLIAAFNEEAVLERSITALAAQSTPPAGMPRPMRCAS